MPSELLAGRVRYVAMMQDAGLPVYLPRYLPIYHQGQVLLLKCKYSGTGIDRYGEAAGKDPVELWLRPIGCFYR